MVVVVVGVGVRIVGGGGVKRMEHRHMCKSI